MVTTIGSRKPIIVKSTSEYIKEARSNKVTLNTSSTSMGQKKTSITRSGVAGGGMGTLVYNVHWKMPKAGMNKK